MVWVLVAVVVVLVLVIGVLVARQRRSQQLREGFGPEYDRVIADQGDRRAGEKELVERQERHDRLEIRALGDSSREEYRERWAATQRRFVDRPEASVEQASVLVRQVMRERGYPVDDDVEQMAADVSVEHPIVVENYRAAHDISARASRGQASTEDLRRAMVHFRALFDDLLDAGDSAGVQHSARARTTDQTPTRG